MKPFLILQLRPEDLAADDEYAAFLECSGLIAEETVRIRMDRDPLPQLDVNDYSGILVGGGPSNVSDPDDKKASPQTQFEPWLQSLLAQIVAHDTPYLGACYGLGALAVQLGGIVSKKRYGEPVEAVTITLTSDGRVDPLLAGLPSEFRALGGHKEAVQEVPPHATLLAGSPTCPIHMIRVKDNVYATQFHPEADGPIFARRIEVYRHAGYFPPEDAEKLTTEVMQESVEIPKTILKRFIDRYKTHKS